MTPQGHQLPDAESRYRALTAIDQSLVVEAGAGTGKTTILAGRIAVLLARGKNPENIVAVTFTESAASELLLRVREYIGRLRQDEFPPGLGDVFNSGISEQEKTCLEKAEENLDNLVCSTIHGFCQRILKTFPVEANIDPGATIMDERQSNRVFKEVLDNWLHKTLSDENGALIAGLMTRYGNNYMSGYRHIQDLANRIRPHRNVKAANPEGFDEKLEEFRNALQSYVAYIKALPVPEPKSKIVADSFTQWRKLAQITSNSNINQLLALIDFPSAHGLVTRMSRTTVTTYSRKARTVDWYSALEGTKKSINGARKKASDEYEHVRSLWNGTVRVALADQLSAYLVDNLKDLLKRYQLYKRSAGLLDFDDLIVGTRDLLCHEKHGLAVRQALARQYQYILVDEFQDTDALQAEIFWCLCSDDDSQDWTSFVLRPGALFVVGDPNQSIYRFRGADVDIYTRARKTFAKDRVLSIVTNFRSSASVLDFVNDRFNQPLSERDQAGYKELQPFRRDSSNSQAVVSVVFNTEEQGLATIHEHEAQIVAQICHELICAGYSAKDIVLLTPAGTGIHLYERELQSRGISFVTQAGKSFFLLQETQDLVTLTCILANGYDHLALGAFLRGPVVGLTDEELLDIVWNLQRDPDEPDRVPRLNALVDLDQIKNEAARKALGHLQSLLRFAQTVTPHALLSAAIDVFHIRALLQQRFNQQSARALANVDLFLELARAYSVRGLKSFARAMYKNWERESKIPEARPDTIRDAVTISTMHNAKGLEWPVVIPINTWRKYRGPEGIAVDRINQQLYAKVLHIPTSGHETFVKTEQKQEDRERVRLWYVASTRARDFLIFTLPDSQQNLKRSWRSVVDLHVDELPEMSLESLPSAPSKSESSIPEPQLQVQSRVQFRRESNKLKQSSSQLTWITPSKDEVPVTDLDAAFLDLGESTTHEAELPPITGPGLMRGQVIHRLIEEILTGETSLDQATERAEILLTQIQSHPEIEPQDSIDPVEISLRVGRALNLPQIRPIIDSLVPECPVYNFASENGASSVIVGIADAISFSPDGTPQLIIDWKSGQVEAHHEEQIAAYMRATSINHGLLVYVDSAQVKEVHL
ncbi:MAG: UvrD-helicase domain-containing protein [Bacteroidetes bacterium]|nr:UvrD-helicase domain-containing protein [Bacteroidota bacterium]MDE2672523.1 UvrD-helicase domain-containing protein [Bacteroidota bacterium]